MGKRGPKPLGQVSTKWSSDLAYAVGLLASDGNLSKDGRHMDLTSKDKGQIIAFKNCLDLNVKIGMKTSGYTGRNDYFRVQFGDVLFYQWLLDIGLAPNKSKTLGELKIPDEHFFDFLRGCFDGDGSMYAYWDPRWHSSYMFYLNFASASPLFLSWLQSTIKRLAKVKGRIGSGGRGRSTQQLRFAKRETTVLFNKMFYSPDIPFLKRKFTKAQKIFTIDQQHNAQVAKLVNVHG